MSFLDANIWLPLVLAAFLGFSVLIYAILDGFQLGVGMLLLSGEPQQKETMLSTLNPLWQMNEVWLLLGTYLLMVAFPNAQSIILNNLLAPAALMMFGLIVRRIAMHCKSRTTAIFIGSLSVSLSQGYMLGSYVLDFPDSLAGVTFAMLVACCMTSSYLLTGSCWLLMQTTGELQIKSLLWARTSLWLSTLGVLLISIALLILSPRIFDKWFSFPEFFIVSLIPLATLAMVIFLALTLRRLSKKTSEYKWVPFALVVGLFITCFHGLAYSFYPYIIPETMTLYEAASSTSSLKIMFISSIIAIPLFFCCTIYGYRSLFHKP